jgi:hypothetical protein
MLSFIRSSLAAGVVAAAVLAFGCSKAGSVVESRPLTTQFDKYRTGAVQVVPEGLEGGPKRSEELLAQLERDLKATGVLHPLAVDQGAELIVRVRKGANLGDEEARVLVDFIDAKSRATIGQITVSANGFGEKDGQSMRRVATAIAEYMRSNRRAPPTAKGNAAPVIVTAPTAERPSAGVATSGVCKTTCTSDSLPMEDQTRLAEGIQPMLKEMRVCLDRVNADSINPAVIARFESNGLMSALKSDTGGYDDSACVQTARSKPPNVAVSRAASARCEYRCMR